MRQLANAFEREVGTFEREVGVSGSHLQSQFLQVDFEGGGGDDVLLAINQMCEDLSARKLP
jgi:hypothetical protein